MTLSVTLLVLVAAALHASWNAMVKATGDRLVMMAWIAGSSALMAIPLALYTGAPAWPVWPYLLATVCVHTGYMLLLVAAYDHGDFGRVYPLARGAAPAIVTLGAFLFADEALSRTALLGICLVAGGIVSLAWRKSREAIEDPGGVGYAMATALTIAGYSVVDGLGGRVASTPLEYTGWLFVLYAAPIVLITLWRRGFAVVFSNRKVAITGIGAAAMSMLAYGVVIWAMSRAPLGPVSALRETSVVFGALISGYVLKEGLGRLAMLAACVVALGVVMLEAAA